MLRAEDPAHNIAISRVYRDASETWDMGILQENPKWFSRERPTVPTSPVTFDYDGTPGNYLSRCAYDSQPWTCPSGMYYYLPGIATLCRQGNHITIWINCLHEWISWWQNKLGESGKEKPNWLQPNMGQAKGRAYKSEARKTEINSESPRKQFTCNIIAGVPKAASTGRCSCGHNIQIHPEPEPQQVLLQAF